MADVRHNVSVRFTGDIRSAQAAMRRLLSEIKKTDKEILASSARTQSQLVAGSKRTQAQLVAGVRKSRGQLVVGMKQTEKDARGSAQRMQRIRGQALQDVGQRGVGLLRGAAAIAGGIGFAAAFQDARNFEKQLLDLAVASGNLNDKFLDKMRGKVTDLSNKYGIGADQIASYAAKIVEATGNSKLATETLGEMAKVGFATGANMADLAGIVTNLSTKLGLSQQQFGGAFEVLATQADKGSFELKDLASELNVVLVAAADLGVRGMAGVRTVGALAQVARRATGSASEAGTALSRFFLQLKVKRADIEKTFGVTLKDGNDQFKDMSTILGDLVRRFKQLSAEGKKFKGGKDIGAKAAELFDVRGSRVFSQLVRDFSTGRGGQLGFQQLAGVSATGGAIEAKAKFREANPAVQLDKAFQKIRNSMRQTMLPVMRELAKLAPSIADGLGLFLKGLGKFAGSIRELVKWVAGVGEFIPGIGSAFKFILKNSNLLISLWLGIKGAMFFRRLMGPVGGAGVGGAAAVGAGAAAGGVAAGGARPATRGQRIGAAAGQFAAVASFAPLIQQLSRSVGDAFFGNAEAIGAAFGKQIKSFQAEEVKRRQREAISGVAIAGRGKNVGTLDAFGKVRRGKGAITAATGGLLAAFGFEGGRAAQVGKFQQFSSADIASLAAARGRARLGTTIAGTRALGAAKGVGGINTTLQAIQGQRLSRQSLDAARKRFGGMRGQFVAGAQEFLKSKEGAAIAKAGVSPEQLVAQIPEVMKIDAILDLLKQATINFENAITTNKEQPIKLFIKLARDTPGGRATANAGNAKRKVTVNQVG